MAIQAVLSELNELSNKARTQEAQFELALREADVQRWSSKCGLSRSELYDEIAAHQAIGFSA